VPELGRDAPVLIAASFQARERQRVMPNPDSLRTDCTVMIVFAVFYIEATVDAIVEKMKMRSQMNAFLNPKNNKYYHPGLRHKLGWFYNEFVATDKVTTKKQLFKREHNITRKIQRKFPGYAKLYKFRNGVSHGTIPSVADSLADSEALRQQAKDIRTELYVIAQRHDPTVKPETTYQDAIA
jgi:hypothetical protein